MLHFLYHDYFQWWIGRNGSLICISSEFLWTATSCNTFRREMAVSTKAPVSLTPIQNEWNTDALIHRCPDKWRKSPHQCLCERAVGAKWDNHNIKKDNCNFFLLFFIYIFKERHWERDFPGNIRFPGNPSSYSPSPVTPVLLFFSYYAPSQ